MPVQVPTSDELRTVESRLEAIIDNLRTRIEAAEVSIQAMKQSIDALSHNQLLNSGEIENVNQTIAEMADTIAGIEDWIAAVEGGSDPAPAPSPAPSPSPSPTPDPDPQPIDERMFGPNAPWNQPIGTLPRHSDWQRYADLLWYGQQPRPGNINMIRNGYAMWNLRNATEIYAISAQYGSADGTSVAFHPDWEPAQENGDYQLILYDPDTGEMWEFWMAQIDHASQVINARRATKLPFDYRTYEGGHEVSRGIGIQYAAMLLRPEDLLGERIRHALSMRIYNPSGNEAWWPATKIEHPEYGDGIPEGSRWHLDVTDAEIYAWLQDRHEPRNHEALRKIAVCLREYGWFITDTSGGPGLIDMQANVEDRFLAAGLGPFDYNWPRFPDDALDGLLQRDRLVIHEPMGAILR